MASKKFELDELGSITVIKSRSNRHLRLTIASGGQVRVSIPTWAPYKAGLDFARTKQGWIMSKKPAIIYLHQNQPIGRAHRLEFKTGTNIDHIKTRITGNTISVSHPLEISYSDLGVQNAALKASVKALRTQAQSLLPQRLAILSSENLLPYKDVQIKQLARRWGSCDQENHIVLNLYLIQLPWELIDYVLLHELTHTVVLNHGPAFWTKLESLIPNAKLLRQKINSFHPAILQA